MEHKIDIEIDFDLFEMLREQQNRFVEVTKYTCEEIGLSNEQINAIISGISNIDYRDDLNPKLKKRSKGVEEYFDVFEEMSRHRDKVLGIVRRARLSVGLTKKQIDTINSRISAAATCQELLPETKNPGFLALQRYLQEEHEAAIPDIKKRISTINENIAVLQEAIREEPSKVNEAILCNQKVKLEALKLRLDPPGYISKLYDNPNDTDDK